MNRVILYLGAESARASRLHQEADALAERLSDQSDGLLDCFGPTATTISTEGLDRDGIEIHCGVSRDFRVPLADPDRALIDGLRDLAGQLSALADRLEGGAI